MDRTYASDKQRIDSLIQNLSWETCKKDTFDKKWQTVKDLVYAFRKKRGIDKTWQNMS